MTDIAVAIEHASTLVAFPIAAAILGSVVAVVKPPGRRLTSAVQHFAAGVVLAALAGEILPDLREEHSLSWAITGFIVGAIVMLILSAISRKIEARDTTSQRLPVGLLITVSIDLLLDGLLVGLGSSLGSQQGLILTIALTIEILFIGLSVTTTLRSSGTSRVRSVIITSVLGLVTGIGAIGGAGFLGSANAQELSFVLAFGAAALLYLVVEELLTEAHEQAETVALTAMFFLGFLTIYVLAAL